MKLYVPEIGESLELTSDWHFPLHHEYRNESLLDMLHGKGQWDMEYTTATRWYRSQIHGRQINVGPTPITLPAGTVLKVDRLYIRKGAKEFSSLTFNVVDTTHPQLVKGKKRFWSKLKDCNNIEFNKV